MSCSNEVHHVLCFLTLSLEDKLFQMESKILVNKIKLTPSGKATLLFQEGGKIISRCFIGVHMPEIIRYNSIEPLLGDKLSFPIKLIRCPNWPLGLGYNESCFDRGT